MTARSIQELVETHRDVVRSLMRKEGGRLLRHESLEDLVQGALVRALERSAGFTYQGEGQFVSWLRTVAHSYLVDRVAYWTALRRRPAALLRLTGADVTAQPGAAREPAIDVTGPTTFAGRREMLETAIRALALLLPRDREIVQRASRGESSHEIAEALGLSHAAADKARTRAVERFRKAFALTSRPEGPAAADARG